MQRSVRRREVHLVVRAHPRMVEIRPHATIREVESAHRSAARVGVVVRAAQRAQRVAAASEAVDAGVIALAAAAVARAVRAAARVRQRAEVIVERVVLLHEDEDVLHLAQVALGARRRGEGEREQREEAGEVFRSHGRLGGRREPTRSAVVEGEKWVTSDRAGSSRIHDQVTPRSRRRQRTIG